MKCAHQEEEAAYETEDHTGTKQIWTEAVSSCDLKQRLNNRPRLRTSKQLCTICSHLSHVEQDRQRARTFFIYFFSLPFFTLPLHAVAYRVQLKSHSPTEVIYFPLTNWWAMMLRPAHTLFNTFSSGIAGNIQPVWSERGFFFSFSFCRANSSSVLEVADR